MNEFQQYPFAEKLIECWRNNNLFLNEKDFSVDHINHIQRTYTIHEKNFWNSYVITLLNFSMTLKDQKTQNLNISAECVYLKKELRNPPKLKEHQNRKYERIRLERQLHKWIINLKYQQTLVDMINICVRYPDVSQVVIQSTNLNFTNGIIHLEGRVNLNRLKELAESMLETTKSNPPVIRHITNNSDAKILKYIEEITDEIKKTKRMTFKSTEEIKDRLSHIVTNPLEEIDETDRDYYVTTMLEIYDVLFYLARMLQKNQPGQLASEVMNQLVHVENILHKVDLEVVQTIGKMLDPEIMEGVGTVSQSQYSHLKEYYVADEILRGFKDGRNNKLIREAKVITVLN